LAAGIANSEYLQSLNEGSAGGTLVDISNVKSTAPMARLLVLGFAPIVPVIAVPFLIKEHVQTYIWRVESTDYRENITGALLALLALNLIGLATLYRYQFFSLVGMILTGILVISSVACIAGIALKVIQQSKWKSYWIERLMDVMAISARANDHARFNRALMLRTSVRAEPNMPLPGGFALYTAIFSAIQLGFLAFYRWEIGREVIGL
jgi:hypothetical protein